MFSARALAAAAASLAASTHCEVSEEALRDLNYSHETAPITDNNAAFRISSAVSRP